MAKLTCEQLKALKANIRVRDKETRRLIERGLSNDKEARKVIIENREITNDLRNRLRDANRPLSKTMRLMNMGRGLVTSRMYTSMNNLLGNALRTANESAKVPARLLAEAAGASKEGVVLGSVVENWLDMVRASRLSKKGQTKRQIDELLKLSDQYDRGFNTWASDVARNVGSDAPGRTERVFSQAEKVVNKLGVMNRLSDELFFRPAFLTRLREIARREGFDLADALGADQLGRIKEEWVREATDHAMDMTYKRETTQALTGTLGRQLAEAGGNAAWLTVLPFPRFMANSYRFMLDHSPIGLFKGIASKDSRKIASGVNGSIMMFTAYQLREELGGDRWYEINLPNGETVDIRRWSPAWAPYMLVADLAKRASEGTATATAYRDAAEQLSGANLRGGVGASMVGWLEDMVRNEADPTEATIEFGEKALADLVGRYVAPITQFKDFAQTGALDALGVDGEGLRKRRDVAKNPVGRLTSTITGGKDLPELESSTREATPRVTPSGATGRFLGQRVDEPKNRIESELDKMGIARVGFGSIAPGSGVPKWDRLLRKHMGPLVEERMDAFLDGDYAQIEASVRDAGVSKAEWQRQINREKRKALKDFFKEIRADAKDLALEEPEGPALYEKKKAKGLGEEELARRQYELPDEERVDPDEEE